MYFFVNTVDELLSMNNDLVLIDAVVELPHVIVITPGIGDNGSARQHMRRNNAFKHGCITLCDHLKIAMTTTALDQTNEIARIISLFQVTFLIAKGEISFTECYLRIYVRLVLMISFAVQDCFHVFSVYYVLLLLCYLSVFF